MTSRLRSHLMNTLSTFVIDMEKDAVRVLDAEL